MTMQRDPSGAWSSQTFDEGCASLAWPAADGDKRAKREEKNC
jgi:hypothetical protein